MHIERNGQEDILRYASDRQHRVQKGLGRCIERFGPPQRRKTLALMREDAPHMVQYLMANDQNLKGRNRADPFVKVEAGQD